MRAKAKKHTLVSELESWTPKSLTKPGHDCAGESHTAALLRWIAVDSPGDHRLHASTVAASANDQSSYYVFGGHVCHLALLRATQIDIEQERTAKLLAAKEGRPMPPVPQHEARMAWVVRERELGKRRLSKGQRTTAARAASRDLERLDEVRKEGELLSARLERHAAEYDAVRESMAVPFVASEYFDNARRTDPIARATILLHLLTGMNVPLLVAIAMIGGLRLKSTPVDLNHPDLRGIYRKHAKNLAGFCKVQQMSRGRWSPVEPE